ncbi:MAG: PAS domain S-box protein [Gammaproteobacteria bacterium]|nr:PAS domain S-box protein [Gammaproteobacteria bacterium]
MKRLKSKISRILVIYIVLFSSAITLILTAIQLNLDYKNGLTFLQQRINQIKLTNTDSIKQALWTLDNSSIQIQLDGMSRINDVIFVNVTDQNNQVIAQSGKINTKNIITSKITLSKEYRGKDTFLGTLTVIVTKENLYQQLIDTVIVILISQAIKTFLVSLFVLIIFYYLVTRHLEKIARHSDKLEISTKAEPLVLNRTRFHKYHDDELKHVVDSINRMSNNIYESYSKMIDNQIELAEREAKFSAIFDSISDAVVIVDNNMQIVQLNPAFIEQFGYTFDELKGQTTRLLFAHPEDYTRHGKNRYEPDTQPGSRAVTSIYNTDYRRKDGSTFPGETLGGAIKLTAGSLRGYIAIIRDTTERVKAKNEEQLLQQQLQQSQKLESIGQLTGGIAHDFNNILASILGYSELTMMQLSKYNDKDLDNYVEQIQLAGERARDLVAQMLSFSRSTPGEPQQVKLPELIHEVVTLLRPAIPSSIKLLTEIDEKVPMVLMDITQMHQVIMNLCINARDAIVNDGTLTIKLSYDKNVDSICTSCKDILHGEFVKLTIQDTGSGIKPELTDSIFEPFMSTKGVGKGTGMGLSVVHGILHKHHSHIIVESEINLGSSFHILIPPFNASTENNKPDDIKEKITVDDGKQKNILVVDDEESIAVFLKSLLTTYNYRVTYTTSSKDAVKLFTTSPNDFDLIITDQTMPELSGTEMIKQIFDIKPDIPVILCSGYSENINMDSALEMGCATYLEKPVKGKTLLKTLHEILSNK